MTLRPKKATEILKWRRECRLLGKGEEGQKYCRGPPESIQLAGNFPSLITAEKGVEYSKEHDHAHTNTRMIYNKT